MQVCDALEAIAKGNVDRFAIMDIEKQQGFRAYSKEWAQKFEDGVLALTTRTRPRIVFPTDKSPRVFAIDTSSATIEEAATTDGVNYEFRAPTGPKRT